MKKPWYATVLYVTLLDIIVVLGMFYTDHWYVKLIFYAILGCGIALRIVMADKREREYSLNNQFNTKVPRRAEPWSLPLSVEILILLFLPVIGLLVTVSYFVSNFFAVFLHISIYNAVLILLSPMLRKHFSARVCATLWSLPSIIYIAFIPLVQKDQPFWVIPIPVTVGNWLPMIWIIGFAVTMLYHCINHLLYRRKILKNARRDWDIDLQRMWYDILDKDCFRKQYYPVIRSGEVTTPLSIGLFKKTIRVVLPQKEYTPEELHLILRHEATHIVRRDSLVKFFMLFCTAVCWFNPLSWIALHHCSADMELSCDEIVLLGEGEETKQRYAQLLLKTAGDDRGFSSCLSASAKTMLYRLNQVLKPQKRFLGAVAAAIAMFLILSTFGLVAVAYDPTPGSALLDAVETKYWGNDVIYKVNDERTDYVYDDISVLLDYVSDITFYQLSGTYSYPNDDMSIVFASYQNEDRSYYKSPNGIISNGGLEFILRDHTLIIVDYAAGMKSDIYYHNADIDWENLISQATPIA